MANSKLHSPRLGFKFFKEHAKSQEPFTIEELMQATDWSESSIDTYRGKQWRDLLEKVDDEHLRVRREFLRLTEKEFLDHITQRRPLFAKYERRAHPALLIFEFLLPLTRESQLRAALDELFYADTIEQRILEIGLDGMHSLLPRNTDESDEDYLRRAVQFANRFYGYSISHVSGRFRAASDLMTRLEAADHIVGGGRYLIDETTAVVRFVLPLETGSTTFPDSLIIPPSFEEDADLDLDAIEAEANTLRQMFFLLFAEAIVRTIKGEDEIWLLERGFRDRLYRWSHVSK